VPRCSPPLPPPPLPLPLPPPLHHYYLPRRLSTATTATPGIITPDIITHSGGDVSQWS
jgi:hypothetical protein